MALLRRISLICDRLNQYIGHTTRWLALAMVIMMTANVAMRYMFSMGEPWQQELVRFCHAILFLAGAGYALQCDAHVRVDILYQNMKPRAQAMVNTLGTVFFLIPFACALIYFSLGYVMNAWSIYESSNEFNGMPGVFILKSFIWVSAATLLIQAASLLINSCLILTTSHHEAING